jgi:hypothetical protein
MGYMLSDLAAMYLWNPEMTMYILHHWAVVLYLTAALLSGNGDLAACICIFVGEVSHTRNPKP